MATGLIILAIIFCIASAIHPFKIGKIYINIATGPLIAFAGLLCLGVIDSKIIFSGILGNSQLRPWEIIVIFFSVAYVSVSLDVTGVLDYLAYRIVLKSKGSGIKLFIFFYLFSCFLTVFTSNDIVILTLTPIIFYLGKHTRLNITPLLFAEFFGANTLSMLLYIGNPTNIIIGNAMGLGFAEFSRIMWFPTLAAAVSQLVLLFLYFRTSITRVFLPVNGSTYYVRNWIDAGISSAGLVLMLLVLTASQWLQIPIWKVTLLFAALFMAEDLVFTLYYTVKYNSLDPAELQKVPQEMHQIHGMPVERNEFWMSFRMVPWKILPFVTVFFILVAGLNEYGAVERLARILAQSSTTLPGCLATNGIFGMILANLINNQPMTILYSSILINDVFQTSSTNLQGAAYAVIIASNLGANLTLIGALAGLMWKNILKSKGLNIGYADFLKAGLLITPIVFASALLALYLVLQGQG